MLMVYHKVTWIYILFTYQNKIKPHQKINCFKYFFFQNADKASNFHITNNESTFIVKEIMRSQLTQNVLYFYTASG